MTVESSGESTGAQELARDVFVPTNPVTPGDVQAQVQLRHMQDGRTALLAYSSKDLLVAGCGPEQGWIAVPSEQLVGLQQLVGFDVVAVDVDVPEEWRVAGPAAEGDLR